MHSPHLHLHLRLHRDPAGGRSADPPADQSGRASSSRRSWRLPRREGLPAGLEGGPAVTPGFASPCASRSFSGPLSIPWTGSSTRFLRRERHWLKKVRRIGSLSPAELLRPPAKNFRGIEIAVAIGRELMHGPE